MGEYSLDQNLEKKWAEVIQRGFRKASKQQGSSTDESSISLSAMKTAAREINEAQSLGVNISTIEQDHYPEILREIPDPPTVVFHRGTIPKNTCVAIVGARKCSSYGMEAARAFSSYCTKSGLSVVSGLARGIDAAAHKAAIEAVKDNYEAKRTAGIAVLGCGVMVNYPKSNHQIYGDILSNNGAIISEFGLHETPRKQHFPRRNRIISGLSKCTIVIEARENSGSLITSRLALEQGREVLAVPGSIFSDLSRGSNKLISEGATCLFSVDCLKHLLDEIIYLQNRDDIQLNSSEISPLISLLAEKGSMTLSEAQNYLNIDHSKLRRLVLNLELSGNISLRSDSRMHLRN